MLKGNQKKLDKNKDGKISGIDFKMMKARYGTMAKSKDEAKKKKIKEIRQKKGGVMEEMKVSQMNMGGESKGYGAARTSGMGLQDEQLVPGKSLDYYKDIM